MKSVRSFLELLVLGMSIAVSHHAMAESNGAPVVLEGDKEIRVRVDIAKRLNLDSKIDALLNADLYAEQEIAGNPSSLPAGAQIGTAYVQRLPKSMAVRYIDLNIGGSSTTYEIFDSSSDVSVAILLAEKEIADEIARINPAFYLKLESLAFSHE